MSESPDELLIEAMDLVHLAAFVAATKHEEAVSEVDFVRQTEDEHLDCCQGSRPETDSECLVEICRLTNR
jgi:hypothetical protein